MSKLETRTKQYIDDERIDAIHGLSIRTFSGEEDYEVMLKLWYAARDFNCFDWTYSLEKMQQIPNRLPNLDPYLQIWIAEYKGQPCAYSFYNWQVEQDGANAEAQYILPFTIAIAEPFWNLGIHEVLFALIDDSVQALAASLPDDKPKLMSLYRMAMADKQVAFYQSKGFQAHRYFFEMTRPIERPLDEHPLAEGIEIREVKPEHYHQIWDADGEAFRDHWGYVEPDENQYEAWTKNDDFQPHLWKVAWEGDEVVGRVGNMLDSEENEEFGRKRGYTEDISVRKAWRGKGIAKALIAESIRMFKGMGMQETALSVDAENPSGALKLYTDMGYEELKHETGVILRKEL